MEEEPQQQLFNISSICSSDTEQLRSIRSELETLIASCNDEKEKALLAGYLAHCCYRQSEFLETQAQIDAINPSFFLAEDSECLWPYYGKHLLQIGEIQRLESTISQLPFDYFVYDYRNMFSELSEVRNITNRPKVLFNTLPKSGTVFLNALLSSAWSAKTILAPINQFPVSPISAAFLKRTPDPCDAFFHGHFPATPSNIEIIEQYFDKIIIHVRDPRQAILSWSNFIQDDFKTTGPYLYPIPDQFSNFSEEDKNQLFYKDHFNQFCEWLEGWKKASTQLGEKLLLLRYEDFVESPKTYFATLLEFAGIESDLEEVLNTNQSMRTHARENRSFHFRSGKTDSWKSSINTTSVNLLNQYSTSDLLSYFGWPTK